MSLTLVGCGNFYSIFTLPFRLIQCSVSVFEQSVVRIRGRIGESKSNANSDTPVRCLLKLMGRNLFQYPLSDNHPLISIRMSQNSNKLLTAPPRDGICF